VVSIFTYRHERKLFALIGAVIVAASIALIQLEFARAGRPSPITVGVTSAALAFQTAVAATTDGIRSFGGAVADAPRLYRENARLRSDDAALRAENLRLQAALDGVPDGAALAAAAVRAPGSIAASTVGYDPENQNRIVSLNRGAFAGVKVESGVVAADGVVGRVVEVEPFSSKVLLATDSSSKIPAVVSRGRWWGIAVGTDSRIELRYVSQDAPLKVGDEVVTGAGRSFGAGVAIGRIARLDRVEGALYQNALVEPAVAFGQLHAVLVLARP
jgi:rod shape-determining protein MreC